MSNTYYNCYNLTGSPAIGPNVINASYTYYNCHNLTGSPVCGNNVTNMCSKYYNCQNLTGSPVCGNKVTNMSNTYYNCYNLTGSPVCGNKVTNMSNTYYNCYNLTGSPVCGNNVTDMSGTYYDCTNLKGSPVCGNNVTNMYQTYYNCSNIYGYMDVKSSSIANAVNCFYGRDTSKMLTITVGFTTTSYNTFKTNAITNSTLTWTTPAENGSMYYYNDAANIVIFNSAVSSMRLAFGNARTPFRAACGSRVTDMEQAYYNCRSLVGPPACGPNVTTMNSTYYRCYSISGQPVCGNRVLTMRNAYYRCGNLTGQPVCGPNVTNMLNAYYKCPNLYGDFYVYSDNVSNATGCFFERDTSRRLNIIATDGSISQTNFMYTNTFTDPDRGASNVTGTLSLVVSTSDKPEFEYMLYNSIYNVYFYTNLFWGGGGSN